MREKPSDHVSISYKHDLIMDAAIDKIYAPVFGKEFRRESVKRWPRGSRKVKGKNKRLEDKLEV